MPHYDNPGAPPVADSLVDVQFSVFTGLRNKGYMSCDSRPGATNREPISKSKAGRPRKNPPKYSRCPKCGGMVLAPCIACNPESTYDRKIDTPRVTRKRARKHTEPSDG